MTGKVTQRRRSGLIGVTVLTACLLFGQFIIHSNVTVDEKTDVRIDSPHNSADRKSVGITAGRRLLQEPLNCTPRSLDQFPAGLLTEEQRQNGGIALHILVACYIFAAFAIVCDDYFVSSLESICRALDLQPDVAGATFMAAGSSAPELFTSIIAVFFAKSDVGVGTIVGSAVFNLLVIVAICSIFGGMIIYLTWWPMCRDCFWYIISIITLVLVMYDEEVHWYEALVMVILYVMYCVMMYFNPRLGKFCISKVDQLKTCMGESVTSDSDETRALIGHQKSSGQTASWDGGEEKYGACGDEEDKLCSSTGSVSKTEFIHSSTGSVSKTEFIHSSTRLLSIKLSEAGDDDYTSSLEFPSDRFARFRWIIMLPASVVFFLTIPDCRRPGCWKGTYAATFTLSIVWIAAMSYVLVWMVTVVGDTFGIPDTVMGLTLLAAGTSVPDALSSLFAARDGYGDMAVSNSVGSNIFDILLCLGLPWLIQTGMVKPNSVVYISSSGLTFSVLILLATVIFLLIALLFNKWRLTKVLGVVCLLVYAVVITFSCLYEIGTFGQTPLPPC